MEEAVPSQWPYFSGETIQSGKHHIHLIIIYPYFTSLHQPPSHRFALLPPFSPLSRGRYAFADATSRHLKKRRCLSLSLSSRAHFLNTETCWLVTSSSTRSRLLSVLCWRRKAVLTKHVKRTYERPSLSVASRNPPVPLILSLDPLGLNLARVLESNALRV